MILHLFLCILVAVQFQFIDTCGWLENFHNDIDDICWQEEKLENVWSTLCHFTIVPQICGFAFHSFSYLQLQLTKVSHDPKILSFTHH